MRKLIDKSTFYDKPIRPDPYTLKTPNDLSVAIWLLPFFTVVRLSLLTIVTRLSFFIAVFTFWLGFLALHRLSFFSIIGFFTVCRLLLAIAILRARVHLDSVALLIVVALGAVGVFTTVFGVFALCRLFFWRCIVLGGWNVLALLWVVEMRALIRVRKKMHEVCMIRAHRKLLALSAFQQEEMM